LIDASDKDMVEEVENLIVRSSSINTCQLSNLISVQDKYQMQGLTEVNLMTTITEEVPSLTLLQLGVLISQLH